MTLSTTSLKTHIAQQLYESVAEQSPSSYYVFYGHPQAWPSETAPPNPDESQQTQVSIYKDMLFGKVVSNTDVTMMVSRYDWTTNTVYAAYDNSDPTLMSKQFYVSTFDGSSYHIFKCLDNNGGAPSTIMPLRENTSEYDERYVTSDGYHWKYMYSVEETFFVRFSSANSMPVVLNANVINTAVPGTVDVIKIEESTTKYDCYTSGYFNETAVGGDLTIFTIDGVSSANTGYYIGSSVKITEGPGNGEQRTITNYFISGGQKRIVIDTPFTELPSVSSRYEIFPNVIVSGDGSGAVARLVINTNSNTAAYVDVVSRGQNYTFANAVVVSNTGITLADTTTLKPIISPSKGHGSNPYQELGATSVGFSVILSSSENGLVSTHGSYRQIGLIKDPKFSDVEFTLANTSGLFEEGERVYQENRNASATVVEYNASANTIKVTNSSPGFVIGEPIHATVTNSYSTVSDIRITNIDKNFNTFDQRLRFNITLGAGEFVDGDVVTQEITGATAYVHEANSTLVSTYGSVGTFVPTTPFTPYYITTGSASANITSIMQPDVIRGSGDLLYIDNIAPITRGDLQTEIIKFVVKF